MPPVFPWLQRLGDIDDDEMERVFNMGIGLALVFDPYYENSIRHMLGEFGLANWIVGHITSGPRAVVWK